MQVIGFDRLYLEDSCTHDTVAQLPGYSDTTYFCKVFKKENGVSPKTFGAREE